MIQACIDCSPDNVRPPFVVLTEHVEQEEIHIIVQRLVIQKQFCQVAQILAILLFLLPIHLPAQLSDLSSGGQPLGNE